MAISQNIKSIPVVNAKGQFVGLVSPHTILHILHSEYVEDLLESAGISSEAGKILKAKPLFLFKARLPWLILGFLGGLLVAQIVEFFKAPLKEYFILVGFSPLISYMTDAIGTQTQIIFVRNITLRKNIDFKNYALREIKVGVMLSLFFGFFLFLTSQFWTDSYFISLIIAFSLAISTIFAVLIPLFLTLFLKKFRKDPALASGPLLTILLDIISLTFYFSLSSLLLSWFA